MGPVAVGLLLLQLPFLALSALLLEAPLKRRWQALCLLLCLLLLRLMLLLPWYPCGSL